MEPRKLTSADIDKVRDIEGFPIATDEAIIELSDAPYYTACPNPFIGEYIAEHGKPYDKSTDSYHREPFTVDVSEGKHDPLYMAHSYHTKVPYKAIMRYLLHYTEPGDVVLDGFCGSGMTGAAALMCGDASTCSQIGVNAKQSMGQRHALLFDISTEAAFIAGRYNNEIDIVAFESEARKILHTLHSECDWMYKTVAPGSNAHGRISYTIWSEMYVCPNCSEEFSYWEAAVQDEPEKESKTIVCPYCGTSMHKGECAIASETHYDETVGETVTQGKFVPVRINYEFSGKRYRKVPDDDDLSIIRQIDAMRISEWYPTDRMKDGQESRRNDRTGVTNVNHFYTKRNLAVISKCHELISKVEREDLKLPLLFWLSSIYSRSHRLNRYMPNHHRHVGPLSGTLYLPYLQAEINILNLLEDKLRAVLNLGLLRGHSLVSTQSSTELRGVPTNSVDYIFVDPPFGDNLNYSELNFIQESWLRCFTNDDNETIVNLSRGKDILDYQSLLEGSFEEFFRVLKPNRWITVEFHNSKNRIWNSIQQAIQRAGFVIADVRTLDKQKGTTKQLSYSMTVKQDLVISSYKPQYEVSTSTGLDSSEEESAWGFTANHLSQLPVVVNNESGIEPIAERQAYMLYDRMVAYHVMRGMPVPLDASDYYRGLDERYAFRDGMYFLPNQINEYDVARLNLDIETIEFAMIVTNEKTAIGWLYQLLANEPQAYAEIQPKFMQEVKKVDRYEAMPELAVLLEENFLQDDKGRWYVPDTKKEGDIAKLREKSLLREFDGYLKSKGRLKLFRSEAIRVGFSRLWKDKNYQAIVDLAKRLPAKTVQEDPNLLMYYDISLSRVD
ncbi:MAG: hypothetical protein IKG21_05520 [Atopobiaceae bacterium]|nr:hypothetical protein [Atopobiaceae bacterium]